MSMPHASTITRLDSASRSLTSLLTICFSFPRLLLVLNPTTNLSGTFSFLRCQPTSSRMEGEPDRVGRNLNAGA